MVDLNETYHGIDLAMKIKQEFRNTPKKIWIRLDSGDVCAQTLYALQTQQRLGLMDPVKDKIVVEGIEHIDEMAAIDEKVRAAGFDPKQFVLYGAGGLLISDHTTRADVSSAFKLSRRSDGKPTMKFSNSPGKESIPGQPTLVEQDGRRIIAQEGEFPNAPSLFIRAYDGKNLLIKDDLQAARARAEKSFSQIQDLALQKGRSEKSPETEQLIEEIKKRTMRRMPRTG